jgi:hypothetical protein
MTKSEEFTEKQWLEILDKDYIDLLKTLKDIRLELGIITAIMLILFSFGTYVFIQFLRAFMK